MLAVIKAFYKLYKQKQEEEERRDSLRRIYPPPGHGYQPKQSIRHLGPPSAPLERKLKC